MEYIKEAKPRTDQGSHLLKNLVTDIIHRVKSEGDKALMEYNHRFGGSDRQRFLVSREELDNAYKEVSLEEISDIKTAAANIKAFAEAQKSTIGSLDNFQPSSGVFLGHKAIPVSACCCYVPGGSYPLYSTALMLIIPAKVAGVKRVATCSPCIGGSQRVDSKTLVAMDIAGADEIYGLGGAQSIAAFSYGTEQIEPVDLIVGPGNQYVTEAKRQCYGQVGIDFIAGPSEVLILADETASPKVIAADILAQSEHDELAKGILITTSSNLAQETIREVEKQLKDLPTGEKAARAWEDYGEIILVDDIEEAIILTNNYAPEHLEVILKKQEEVIPQLINYGSLFVGAYSAEVFGDYASGTNHTLPTMRAARYTGGVWVGTFLKICTYQRIEKGAMKTMVPLVSRLAKGEGLIAHARAAEVREHL